MLFQFRRPHRRLLTRGDNLIPKSDLLRRQVGSAPETAPAAEDDVEALFLPGGEFGELSWQAFWRSDAHDAGLTRFDELRQVADAADRHIDMATQHRGGALTAGREDRRIPGLSGDARQEERRGGKDCVSQCRSWGATVT